MTKFWKKELSNISDNAIFGENCIVHSHCVIYDEVIIGDNCKIQSGVFIPNGVTIGDDVFIGPNVTFTNDKYPPSGNWSKTIVDTYVSIGAGATILPGITIGEGAKVGAGSVVTKDIPKNEIWIGNPAIPFGLRSSYPKLKYNKNIDTELANYICGFVDGEGSFGKSKNGKYLQFRFAIESDYRDKDLYGEIKKIFTTAKEYERRRETLVNKLSCHTMSLVVGNKQGLLEEVIPFFDTFELKGFKKIKYLRWREDYLNHINT